MSSRVDTKLFTGIFSIPVKAKKRKVVPRFSKLQYKAKDKGVMLEKCGSCYELWVLGTTAECRNLNEVEQTLNNYKLGGSL